LTDAYLGPEGVLMGSARVAQEVRAQADSMRRSQELKGRTRGLETRRAMLEAQMASLKQEVSCLDEEMEMSKVEAKGQDEALARGRDDMARIRKAD